MSMTNAQALNKFWHELSDDIPLDVRGHMVAEVSRWLVNESTSGLVVSEESSYV